MTHPNCPEQGKINTTFPDKNILIDRRPDRQIDIVILFCSTIHPERCGGSRNTNYYTFLVFQGMFHIFNLKSKNEI